MYCNKHQQYLDNHCRFCGKPFGKQTRYSCTKYASIVELFGVDHTCDNPDVHPTKFCNRCYSAAMRTTHSTKCTSLLTSVEWFPHNDICAVCDGQHRLEDPKCYDIQEAVYQILRLTSAPCLAIVYLILVFHRL